MGVVFWHRDKWGMRKGLLKWERRACKRVACGREGGSKKRQKKGSESRWGQREGAQPQGQPREEERAMEGRQGVLQQSNRVVGVLHAASWMLLEGWARSPGSQNRSFLLPC